jgi:hypothetical protein
MIPISHIENELVAQMRMARSKKIPNSQANVSLVGLPHERQFRSGSPSPAH